MHCNCMWTGFEACACTASWPHVRKKNSFHKFMWQEFSWEKFSWFHAIHKIFITSNYFWSTVSPHCSLHYAYNMCRRYCQILKKQTERIQPAKTCYEGMVHSLSVVFISNLISCSLPSSMLVSSGHQYTRPPDPMIHTWFPFQFGWDGVAIRKYLLQHCIMLSFWKSV